jgi:hypothetical protein
MMKRIDSAHLLRAVGDEAWSLIDRSMHAGATVEDVITAVLFVHVSIAAERRFGDWSAKIRDIQLTYLDCLALRLQEVDAGSIAFAQAAANAIGRAREACGD